MKLELLSVLFVLVSPGRLVQAGFFYSSRPSEECFSLPWKYMSCIKVGSEYRKQENSASLSHAGRDCSSESKSRTTEPCSKAEFITSTILKAVSSRQQSQDTGSSRQGLSLGADNILFNRAIGENDFRRPLSSSQPKVCASTFTDPDTGVKMLGAICPNRNRITIIKEVVKSRVRRQFGGSLESEKHRDILFLLDASGSVNKANFKMELEFVKTLAEKFAFPRHIGPDATRVALTSFSSNHAHHIDFLDSPRIRDFKDALTNIRYTNGATCLISALKAVRDESFTRAGRSRIPLGTADGLLILITDGCLNCHSADITQALQTEQKLFEEMGVSILTFMINVGGSCEASFRALQDGSKCFQGFSYPSWAEFEKMIMSMRDQQEFITRWTKIAEQCP